ncbi:MAG: VOC family protein [Ginsengibacter sp.]
MNQHITGIQQVGIGVTDAQDAKHLYKTLFGMDVLIFEDTAAATLMTKYTGNLVHQRKALLSINMAGGGGFEIWQYISRQPEPASREYQLGDLGIFAVKIKSPDIAKAHRYFSSIGGIRLSEMQIAPDDRPHFWIADKYGNNFEIVEGDEWFKTGKGICGGVVGAVIGVSDMSEALPFYRDVLGISDVIYSGSAPVMDVPAGAIAGQAMKRVLLKKGVANRGAFSKLLGAVQIELVETTERSPLKIYADRYWGDCGFIHLCFDVFNMDALKLSAGSAGFHFSIDSADSFSMGSTAGRFCYVEDPDGTLIELVETHKIPILQKIGWYLDLKKRNHDKPLPDWLINMLALNKIR